MMMEKPENVEAQEKVARILEVKWHCSAEPLATFYHVDYALTKHTTRQSHLIDALVEVKVRLTLERQRNDYYMIGAYKVLRMLELMAFAPVFLVVQFADWLAYWKARPLVAPNVNPLPLYVGGRADRKERGRDDIEPTFRIPLCEFVEVTQCHTR